MEELKAAINDHDPNRTSDALKALPEELLVDDNWAFVVDEFGENTLQKAASGDEDVMRIVVTHLKDQNSILKLFEILFFSPLIFIFILQLA